MAEMEFKGTPGPWVVVTGMSDTGHSLAVAKADHAFKGTAVCLVSPMDSTDEFDAPNASLIAAAPDLLEALEYLVSLGGGDALNSARAAIAKALQS